MAGLTTRNKIYYALFYVGKKQKRKSLDTKSLQVAKEKLRQLESSLYKGRDTHLPTKTPIPDVITAYIENMETRKTLESVKRDVSCLRNAFGPICPALDLKNVKNSELKKKYSAKNAPPLLEAACFEAVTTAQIVKFLSEQVRCKGLKPKTANRYREVLTRLYNWAMSQNGIRIAEDKNPAAQVDKYLESAPQISFLTMPQIGEQLSALSECPELQTMVAMYIYAGLRREELCWLTVADVDFSAGSNGILRITAKTINGEFWEPKTKTNRVVPVSTALRQYLDRYLPPVAEGGWFFATPTGKRWNPDNLSGKLSEANRRAGLCWTCLDFRHTFGSQLAMKGESLYKISKIMGNSPDICRKHYAALLPESLVESVEFGNAAPFPLIPASPKEVSAVVPQKQGKSLLKLVVVNP